MDKYLILSNLTDEGRKTILDNPERIEEVNRELEEKGANVINQYVLLGKYDFLTVVEAPSKADITKIVMEVASRGSIDTMTLPAMDVDELIEKVK
ncbi:MAG: GYD domain-containing protein [Candidatus Thermoplasmatota archaeon]|nr:GYD domain-containing protein [Candidatus Thermoplasmatota archaeon]